MKPPISESDGPLSDTTRPWLVTGGSGFLGRHVLAAIGREAPTGAAVVALGRTCPPGWPPEAFVRSDLLDAAGLIEVFARLKPGVVLHAAGQTPPASTARLFAGNVRTTVHLLDAIRAAGRSTRLVLAGSAAELGPVPTEGLPASESSPCRPVGPYGLSKWFAGKAALLWGPPAEVMVARVFNPIGPGLPTSQAFGRFAERLAEPGPDPVHLAVGDLDARRDFIDIRDAARALILLALRGRPGEVYHVGTGRSHRVGEGLEYLIHRSGRATVIAMASALVPTGPSDSRADIRRIGEQTGWSPDVAWEQSLDDLWDEARGRVRLPLTAARASL